MRAEEEQKQFISTCTVAYAMLVFAGTQTPTVLFKRQTLFHSSFTWNNYIIQLLQMTTSISMLFGFVLVGFFFLKDTSSGLVSFSSTCENTGNRLSIVKYQSLLTSLVA